MRKSKKNEVFFTKNSEKHECFHFFIHFHSYFKDTWRKKQKVQEKTLKLPFFQIKTAKNSLKLL